MYKNARHFHMKSRTDSFSPGSSYVDTFGEHCIFSISKTYLRGVIREIGLVEYLCLVSLHGFHFHLVGRILPRPVPATVYAAIILPPKTTAKNICKCSCCHVGFFITFFVASGLNEQELSCAP